MTRAEIESTYQISRRIEGEERALDTAMVVFTSTQQEIDQQWGLYDGYEADPTASNSASLHTPLQRWGLARILRTRMQAGRVMPLMRVIPPGLDFSSLKVELPEDPVLKVLRERKAAAMGSVPGSFLNLAGLVSPSSQPTTPAAGRSDGAWCRCCGDGCHCSPWCEWHGAWYLTGDCYQQVSSQRAVKTRLSQPTTKRPTRQWWRRSRPFGKRRFAFCANRTSRPSSP